MNYHVAAAALCFGLAGILLTFAPAETAAVLGGVASPVQMWFAQLLGAALLALS